MTYVPPTFVDKEDGGTQHLDAATLNAMTAAIVAAGSAGSGSGLPSTVVSRTTSYTAAAGDFVLADATTTTLTVTLPAAPAVGALVTVKKVDGTVNVVTVVASSGGLVDGDVNATITSPQFGAVFEHVGSNAWKIVAPTSAGGQNGIDGKTLRSGTGAPSNGLGTNGDFYIDLAASLMYGPKASGAWPAGFSIKGADGAIARVQDEGSDLAARGRINFVGGGVTATDDAANGRTNVTIPTSAIVPRGRPVQAGTILHVCPGFNIFAHSAATMPAGRMVYQPLFAATDITIDQFAIQVNAAIAASTARIGLYTAGLDWQPISLVLEPTVTTQLDTSSSGTKTTSSFSQALAAGRYVVALQCSAGIQVDSPFCATEVGGYDIANGPISGWYAASTYGAMPSTPVAWNNHNVGGNGFSFPVLSRVSVA